MNIVAIIIILIFTLVIFRNKLQYGGLDVPTVIVMDEPEQDKITQLLSNQQEMIKLALGKKAKAAAVKRSCASEAQYKDWAPLGLATQSSNYENYMAKNVIDGDLSTFNHTDMSTKVNSWLKITLPVPVEISKIIIENRQDATGSITFRQRLPPFTVTVKNHAGMEVASKTFNDILQTYNWNDVYSVGSEVIIKQLKKNYLHVAEVKIFGVQAKSCEYYEKRVALNREKISPIFQKFKISACLEPQSAAVSAEIIKAQAAKFDQILKKEFALQKAKTAQAKKIWANIQRQQTLERQMTAIAKRFKLPPPKPMYSKAQINLVKKNLESTELNLTDEQKADCMGLYNQIQSMKDNGLSSEVSTLSSLASQLIELQQKYDQQCMPPDKRQDLTTTSLLEPKQSPIKDKEPLNS